MNAEAARLLLPSWLLRFLRWTLEEELSLDEPEEEEDEEDDLSSFLCWLMSFCSYSCSFSYSLPALSEDRDDESEETLRRLLFVSLRKSPSKAGLTFGPASWIGLRSRWGFFATMVREGL